MKKLLIIFLFIFIYSCNTVDKKRFHNSDYTRKRINGIYKYYTRY